MFHAFVKYIFLLIQVVSRIYFDSNNTKTADVCVHSRSCRLYVDGRIKHECRQQRIVCSYGISIAIVVDASHFGWRAVWCIDDAERSPVEELCAAEDEREEEENRETTQ